MPREKNPARRALITAIIALAGLGVVIAFAINSVRTSSQRAVGRAGPEGVERGEQTPTSSLGAATPPRPRTDSPSTPDDGASSGEASSASDARVDSDAAGGIDASAAPRGLRARAFDVDAGALDPLGSLDPSGPYRAEIRFTEYGAGVESITLTDYYNSFRKKQGDHYAVQRLVTQQRYGMDGRPMPPVTIASLASVAVEIAFPGVDAEVVDLRIASGGAAWRPIGPGAFEAMIVDASDAPVARIEKRYVLAPGEISLRIEQRLFNLTSLPMSVVWFQYGPVDLPMDVTGYGIDVRRLRFGHLLTPTRDPSRRFVVADTDLLGRSSLINKRQEFDGRVWPHGALGEPGEDLVWAAMTSRYFAFAVHPLIDADAIAQGVFVDKRFRLAERVHRVVIGPRSAKGSYDVNASSVIVQLTSERMEVGAGDALDLSFGAYAGPLLRSVIREDAARVALGLDQLVVYNLGGMCAPCTFQWLARPLIALLHFVHSYVVFDWALSIMVLVLIVRTILHPVTRRSQIAMLRFSKQMQGLAPKQQKLREKFKDDPKRMQQEMAKLMREEGVSFAGMLGCLPMFLQTPIWIALYASLFFAFELRHEPAFFGVFQRVSGGRWPFLADLSAPDHFIHFGRALVSVPLFGPITSFNILPIVLGVVFYIQQKYLTPPPTTQLTPEQQQQQKMMKIMMVVLFPLMMFNAPSGLSLYFIVNSTLGILESRWIRSHVDKKDLEPRKPPGEGRKRVRNRAEVPVNPFAKRRETPQGPTFKRRKPDR